ncbi:MAG: hypothetical protein GY827_09035 [Cytophagales bacterium]|nr:hypothetical protein [Cytophagales bacterium]
MSKNSDMYEYHKIEGDESLPSFLFKTDNKYQYLIRFEEFYFPLDFGLGESVVVVEFDYADQNGNSRYDKSCVKNIPDNKIAPTIAKILEEVCLNYPNYILFFQCDNTENEGAIRQRLFQYWFNVYNCLPNYKKYNREIRYENTYCYTSLIYNSHLFPEVNLLSSVYKEIENIEQSKS